MAEKKAKLWLWVKAHKKQLLIAGLSITAIAAILIGVKNKEALASLWKELNAKIDQAPVLDMKEPLEMISDPVVESVNSTREYTLPNTPVKVDRHLRTLSGGRQHSAAKAAEAAQLGIELLPNQTIVDSYTKYADAA